MTVLQFDCASCDAIDIQFFMQLVYVIFMLNKLRYLNQMLKTMVIHRLSAKFVALLCIG